LRREGDDIVLIVADDGVGILTTNPPPARAAGDGASDGEDAIPDCPPGHYGIAGMRERVRALGGAFRIGPSAPAGPARGRRGTVVEARVPLHSQAADGAAPWVSPALEVVD